MVYNLALAGQPVEHSRSPAMQDAALREAGLSGSYTLEDCTESGLKHVVSRLRSGELQGLNITMPHKAFAATLADELTPVAARSLSVNTMKMADGLLWGHSTDAIAFQQALNSTRYRGDEPLLILGSGGAAAALLAVADRSMYLAARDEAKARVLCDRFPAQDCRLVGFGTAVVDAVVVNATPLGMRGEPLPDGILEVACGLIDLPYGTGATPAIDEARERGLPVVDGFEFLAMQAAESFHWWTGKTVSVGRMTQAARNV